MKVYLGRCLHIFVFTCMTLFSIPTASAGEVDEFVAKLKMHYQQTLSITAFSLNHHYLNKQHRGLEYWDYQTPNRIMSQRVLEVDLVKKHFYDNDIYFSSGGQLFDRVHYQNDKESFAYERNGSSLGKRIINQGLGNFYRMEYVVMDVDFLVVRPLFEESNIKGNLSLHQDKGSRISTLRHKTSNNNIVDYEFSHNPLQLKSVNDKSKGAIFVYDDYQTSRGLTFARTVYQYYDGAKEPDYVIYNDQFKIIDQVDPAKLKLPQGYGPEIPVSDGVLVSKEIAKDLYLVTDSSAKRNSLFKVNDGNITLFGASGYAALAQKTLKLISEQFPNKKVSSVYVTHPHKSDIAGLKVYAQRGIEVLADAYTIEAIKAYPPFADDISTFKFRVIEHDQVIDEAHFYVLENMHSKRQSFVYFKDSGIIFQADFLHIAFDNTIAKVIPNYTRTFIDFIRNKQLKIKRIVGNYRNNNISVEVMNKTYDAIM